jgi:putative membrane protein
MTSPSGALDTGTRLAYERTRLASERNMMAWIRTATSLISFGFTVYKFFEFEAGKSTPAATGSVLSPRVFALIMIGTGLVALLLSTIEHRRNITRLAVEPGSRDARDDACPCCYDCRHGTGGVWPRCSADEDDASMS